MSRLLPRAHRAKPATIAGAGVIAALGFGAAAAHAATPAAPRPHAVWAPARDIDEPAAPHPCAPGGPPNGPKCSGQMFGHIDGGWQVTK